MYESGDRRGGWLVGKIFRKDCGYLANQLTTPATPIIILVSNNTLLSRDSLHNFAGTNRFETALASQWSKDANS